MAATQHGEGARQYQGDSSRRDPQGLFVFALASGQMPTYLVASA